jgi:uncharacterized protein (DUF1697 family)
MAERQIALLRGINVGKAKRVSMADLRALVESLGYTEVVTLLNSGNVVFTASGAAAKKSAARIEQAIAERLGFTSRVTVLSAAELAAAVAANPLGEVPNPSRLLVAVLSDPADSKRLEPLAREDWAPEVLALGPRVAYVWCPDGLLESRLFEAVGRVLGDAVTSRNWATLTKLHALAGAAPRP